MRYSTTLRYVWFRNGRLLFKRKISQKIRKITEKTGKQQFETRACHSLTRHFSESCCTSLERYNTQLFSKKIILSIGPETSALQSRMLVAVFFCNRIRECIREFDISVIIKMFDHLKSKVDFAVENGLGSLVK